MRYLYSFACLFTLLLTACEGLKPEPKPVLAVEPESMTFYVDGTGQITTNVEDATFSSDEEFYATVSTSGLVTAKKVGKTSITVSSSIGSAKVPVTIIPQYDLYPNVDELIGKNEAAVKAMLGSNYEPSVDSAGQILWTYKDPTSYCVGLGISYKNSVVDAVFSLVSTKYTSMLSSYMKERYAFVGTLNDDFYFRNHDESVAMVLQIYSISYLMVIYAKYTKETKVATPSFPSELADSFAF